MAKYRFCVGTNFATGIQFKEIVELPDDITEDERQEEFEEWLWEQLDAYYEKVE
ncbi:DUF7167 family protein [Heyndrickxia coagulans]|uniref:DUF7167 family protein n=1 Tax=Heyndrickxia coagulans TaxID=1398 RepID=UPI0018A776B9|nr:hypothetical protein [Heyndrickxia coagulans]MBF8418928.1 hypothetical protein [Heyndrickxia coagulans]